MSQSSLSVKKIPWKVQFADTGLILLSILLFNLSFPGGNQPWIAWFALIPLGVAIHGKNIGYVFRSTVSLALLCWLFATWWVIPGVCRIASYNYLVVILFALIFYLFYALPYGVAAMFYSKFNWTTSISGAVKGAMLWTTICCLTPHILPGNLAHSQYLYPRVIQVVELGGIPLLFFLMHLTTFLGVTSVVCWRQNCRYALKAIFLSLLVPILVLGYGELRLNSLKALKQTNSTSLKVGIVQPNISNQARERSDWLREAHYLSLLTERLAKVSPTLDLIVWPEIPPPISYVQYPEDRHLLNNLISLKGIPMIIAGFQRVFSQAQENKEGYYNVAEFLTVDQIPTVYRKQKRLPFGEYLPFKQAFPWLSKLFPRAPNYLAGEESVLFHLNNEIKLMPLICYEAVFPEIVKKGISIGGNVVVNPVNDGWFGNSFAPEIHLALALFRAVEFRVPVIRASNSGRSVLIDMTGEIVPGSETELFQATVSFGNVLIFKKATIYYWIGNGFVWVFALLSVYFFQLEFRGRYV